MQTKNKFYKQSVGNHKAEQSLVPSHWRASLS